MYPGHYSIEVYEGNPFRLFAVLYDMAPYGGPTSLAEPGVEVSARIVPQTGAAVQMEEEVLDAAERRVKVVLPFSLAHWNPSRAYWELRVKKGAFDAAILAGPAYLLPPP